MNICLVSKEYPPETGWGGIGTYTYNLAHGLSELGHQVHVVAYAVNNESEYLDDKVYVHRIREVRLKGLWRVDKLFPISVIFYSIRVALKLRELIKIFKIEIVEAPEWEAELFFYSFIKKVPMVIKFQTPMFLVQELNSLKKTLKRRVLCFLERATVRNADTLISPTHGFARIISQKYIIDETNIRVIPHPIEESTFVPIDSSKNSLTVLYTGRLECRKGVHVLADAIPRVISQFPNVRFLFIGKDTPTSPEHDSMKLYIIKKNRNHVDNISFIDHIERNKLIDYYQKSTICVFPSLWEAFGYTALEAMACGRPVIITDTFGLSEFLENGENVVKVPPLDHTILADAIIMLLKDKDLQNRISISARQIVEKKFRQTIVAKETFDVYQVITSHKNRLIS